MVVQATKVGSQLLHEALNATVGITNIKDHRNPEGHGIYNITVPKGDADAVEASLKDANIEFDEPTYEVGGGVLMRIRADQPSVIALIAQLEAQEHRKKAARSETLTSPATSWVDGVEPSQELSRAGI